MGSGMVYDTMHLVRWVTENGQQSTGHSKAQKQDAFRLRLWKEEVEQRSDIRDIR